MDQLNQAADSITKDILPHVTKQMNCCYLISMTVLACRTKEYSWHKKNWFLSYVKAVLYGFGSDIILSILWGKSSLDAMSINRSLALIALAWWLVLFLPYDVFNRFLNFQVGVTRPMYLTMITFATARRMVKTEETVIACLEAYPGSYIAILAGTLVSNGSLLVAPIFGELASDVSNVVTARLALTASIVFTLVKTDVLFFISPSLALASFVVFGCVVEGLEASGFHFKGFDVIHDGIAELIAMKELVAGGS